MDAATTAIKHGVTLEAISAPELPDTDSLLGELGSEYPILTYAAADQPAETEAD
jgi:hypothetical protein